MICWKEAKSAEVVMGVCLGGPAGSFLPGDEAGLALGPGELWSLTTVWDGRRGRLKLRRPNSADGRCCPGSQLGLRTLEGRRQEVLASRGCPRTRQQEVSGGEEALAATGPRCSRRLSAGGGCGAGRHSERCWGIRPPLPGGGRLQICPATPESHCLPGPQDTCP